MKDNSVLCYSAFGEWTYSDLFPDIGVYYEEDFFLPCHSYSVIIPVIGKHVEDNSQLNIFEITVLKLFDIQSWELSDLASHMGVEEEFVKFLIASLEEKEFLTLERKLTQAGKQYVDSMKQQVDEVDYKLVKVFTLPISNVLLPVVACREQQIKQGYYDREKNCIVFNEGSDAGSERDFSFRCVNVFEKDKNKNSTLDALAVKKVIYEYLSSSRQLKFHHEAYKKCLLVPKKDSRDVFVHFKLILQTNNIRVKCFSDGFLENNLNLKKLLENEASKFLESIEERARRSEESEQDKNGFVKRDYAKYHGVRYFLNNSLPQKGNSADENTESYMKNLDAIRNLFSALEWTLHYFLQRNPLEKTTIDVLQGYDNTSEIIQKAAESIGMKTESDSGKYLRLNIDKASLVRYMQSSNPVLNMDLLVPLCIMQAKYDNSSPWHNLIREMP